MAKNSPDRPDDERQHEDGSGHDDPVDDGADGGSGDDHQSPGRSLLDDDAEIVEPNEPA